MLDAIFRPRAIAVVGASQKDRSIGGRICRNLVDGGFDGRVYPVNPRYDHVCSIPCWPRIEELPDPIDLAVVAVPAEEVLEVARGAADRGARGLVVISAGFGEQGVEGARLQEELTALCRERGMRLVGPNCMGVLNTAPGVSMNATFARTPPIPGNVAFMSQSGALGESILASAARLGLGLSMFASVGNRADVAAADLLAYWRDDPRTDVILLYLEGFGDPRRFVPRLRDVAREKPVVVVKAGTSEAGRRAVLSHTGSLAGLERTADALFAQCGVLRARSVPELFDIARGFASQPLPKGRRVVVVTNAGGPGALAADALEGHGLSLPSLSEGTRRAIASEVDLRASLGNPLDLLASATPRHYAVAMERALADPEVDAVLAIFVPPIVTDARAVLEAIAAASRGAPEKPVLACLMGEEDAIEGVEVLGDERIPVYAFPESAALALEAMARHAEHRARPAEAPEEPPGIDPARVQAILAGAMLTGRKALTPEEGFRVLRAYGIPVVESVAVASPQAARRAASELGWPVALKVSSGRILHKTDVRGVALGLHDGDALEREMLRMYAELSPRDPELAFTVQPMVEGGIELILGVVADRRFGPLVMLGLGGIFAEALGDVAFRLAPLSRGDAHALIDSLRGRALLEGVRGRPPISRERLVDVLLRLGRLAMDFPEIEELDVNPLLAFADPERFTAVDARIVLGDDEADSTLER